MLGSETIKKDKILNFLFKFMNIKKEVVDINAI
jgi:hypothetical protein